MLQPLIITLRSAQASEVRDTQWLNISKKIWYFHHHHKFVYYWLKLSQHKPKKAWLANKKECISHPPISHWFCFPSLTCLPKHLTLPHTPKVFNPSSNFDISPAPSLTCTHLTTLSPSTAKLPAVCHRFPLWVGLFLIPSFHANDTVSIIPVGLNMDPHPAIPNPHCAKTSLSGSVMTLTFPSPPTADSHSSVCSFSLCEMAMNWIFGSWVEARSRKWRKAFSATVVCFIYTCKYISL